MINRPLVFFIIFFSVLTSSEWYFTDNNFWKINTSSRASALGGINLNKFPILSDNQYSNNKVRIYQSNMYKGVIEYNNISYSHKIDECYILDSKINRFNIAFFNRQLDNIIGTSNIWNDEINPPSNSSDINSSLVDYYNHNDFSFLGEIFLQNEVGNFGLHFMPSFSKVDTYSSKSINVDLSYSKDLNDFFLGAIINNFFSYRKWNNNTLERFYPSLSLLINRKLNDMNYFLEIDNIYFNNTKLEDKIKLGLEYNIYAKSNIRFGYNSSYFSVGLGFNIYNKILFDYSYLNHADLGGSNQITLIFLLQTNTAKQ